MTVQALDGRVAVRAGPDAETWVLRGALAALFLMMAVFILAPLGTMVHKSLTGADGAFVGFDNYAVYLRSHGLGRSLVHSLAIALGTTALVVPTAFFFAYGVMRSTVPGRAVFKTIALLPLLAPSLLPALSLVYLFGNQGLLKALVPGGTIYGPLGIMLGMSFYVFPHVFLILLAALAHADGRLYEAAEVLGAGRLRRFAVVTLPGVRYGLVSAVFVAFTLAITDFGVPKVIGGGYDVLATDIYKQVVGQQNFAMGAAVGMILLIPSALAFAADRLAQRRQAAAISARSQPFHPRPSPLRDAVLLMLCLGVSAAILGILGCAAWASLIRFWPYDLSLTLAHYDFTAVSPQGWRPYGNSLILASGTAVVGAGVIFAGAYLIERGRGLEVWRRALHAIAMIPLAVPGMVLGIAYIFFFNAPGNPLGGLYGTMAILIFCTVAHFYTVGHLTALAALKQIDPEYESVSASLRVPFWTTAFKVVVPVCLPAILEIALYLFVNALTTVSAVVFLYAPDTLVASIAVLNMDDVGDSAPAAALATLIFLTALAARLLFQGAVRGLLARSQAWRASGGG
ncbi:putative 2-aminoethylphosphonate ABC transporter permease subunit [Pararhodospirillum oryzae]|uniref:ABC transmembrane type-1 domain-containing protein n=1 Tax=Pararhodospirillum oryzae TaxID=478448 RepID=A0A512H5Q3_9PROT|nr:putative 2-aminoethylphosphonate ABC transporter permease subunit [Pararhodospirillum oryzae]GEO80761.1 hypothetical protein ROR02_08920 [Pararhodospirillum oryzae]